MDIIATIKHNDPEIDERVSLGIVAEDGGFAIRTATGEDAGQYRWTTESEAKAAIAHLWSAGAWDLQWETRNYTYSIRRFQKMYDLLECIGLILAGVIAVWFIHNY